MRRSRLLLRTLLSGPLTGRRRPAECTGTAARWGVRVGKSESGAMGRRSGEEVCAIGREGKGESGGENEQLLSLGALEAIFADT